MVFLPCEPDAEGARQRLANFTMTPASLLTFIAMCFLMGVHHVGSLHDPWSSLADWRIASIAETMTEQSFNNHLHMLHFTSLPFGGPTAGISKIKDYMSSVQAQFRKLWTPGMAVTVDECCLLCKSFACFFRQYNPMKPIKHHIKLFALCCAGGFCLSFWVYTGKDDYKYDSLLGFAADLITKKLCALLGMRGKGHVLFGDNWYSSFRLVEVLAGWGMRYVGTIKLRADSAKAGGAADAGEDAGDQAVKLPFTVTTAHDALPKGWCRIAQLIRPLTVLVGAAVGKFKVATAIYKCRKTFGMIYSAWVGPQQAGEHVLRAFAGSQGAKIKQSSFQAHMQYMKHYGKVDTMDSLISSYKIPVRTNRWYMSLVFYTWDLIMFNMWMICVARRGMEEVSIFNIYKSNGGSTSRGGPHRRFIEDTAFSMIELAREWDRDNAKPFYRPQRMRACSCVKEARRLSTEGASAVPQQPHLADGVDMSHHTTVRCVVSDGRVRCVGCAQILKREPSYTVHKTKEGCEACDAAVCVYCWPHWNHFYSAVPAAFPPAPFETWGQYVDSQ